MPAGAASNADIAEGLLESGSFVLDPRLRRVLLNTTMAAQAVTVRSETLGSSC